MKVLKKSQARNVVVYMFDGAYPAYAIHLNCDSESMLGMSLQMLILACLVVECNTSYRNNYSVHNKVRSLYGGTPDFIQVGEHQFVARKLVEMWVNMMLVGWYACPAIQS